MDNGPGARHRASSNGTGLEALVTDPAAARKALPVAYFEVVATAKAADGEFQMRHAPQDRIVRREVAEAIADAARGFEGALAVKKIITYPRAEVRYLPQNLITDVPRIVAGLRVVPLEI
jgi:DNA topoisomerase III